jgi:hypothetical protein
MDFYVAACAPHVTGGAHPIPSRGAYDYLSVARKNQSPLPTWGYSQAYCMDCWIIVPHGNEIVMQMAAVVAAGSKGMMLFMMGILIDNLILNVRFCLIFCVLYYFSTLRIFCCVRCTQI